jgi:hypothetical protein
LKRCFEPATREKANSQKRILICDSHDSHISADFINHCIQHDIILIRLSLHTSHLLQSLDVSVFAPLKIAITGFLDKLFQTSITIVQKIEWFEAFIKARKIAVTVNNIHSRWRGARIYLLCPEKILNKLPQKLIITSLQSETDKTIAIPFDNTLKEDSPVDSEYLRSANIALKELIIERKPLDTPARKYIPRLEAAVEYLLAENKLLHYEVKACKDVLGARKTRKTGKRMKLEGAVMLSLKEYAEAARDCEAATKAKKKPISKSTGKPRGRPRKNAAKKSELEEEQEEDELEALEQAFAENLIV